MTRLASRRRAFLVAGATVLAAGMSASRLAAGVAENRAEREHCNEIVEHYGSFDVPSAYRPVTYAGGYLQSGTWHPRPADLQKLGASVDTTPTDEFGIAFWAKEMSATPVDGGTVYSHIKCEGLK